MSYGVNGFKTKKALKDAVAAQGPENIRVFGTSIFGNEKATTVAELAAFPHEVIVGPDVYYDRKWYANVKTKKDGTIYIA